MDSKCVTQSWCGDFLGLATTGLLLTPEYVTGLWGNSLGQAAQRLLVWTVFDGLRCIWGGLCDGSFRKQRQVDRHFRSSVVSSLKSA